MEGTSKENATSTVGVQSGRAGLGAISTVFFGLGATTFGGLFAVLPRIERALSERGWLTPAQLTEVLAVSTLVPVPTYVALAGVIGYRLRGWIGGAVAIAALVAPSALVMTVVMWRIPLPILSGPMAPVARAMAITVAGVLFGNGLNMAIRNGRSVQGGLILAVCATGMMLNIPVAFVVIGGLILGRLLQKEDRT